MPRILIIAEKWPDAPGAAARLVPAVREAGYEPVVIAGSAAADTPGLIRIPFEAPRSSAALFHLRNALFFDAAANPGNYSMLRDTLHLHLQEVLYDAVIICCPPEIYLKLAYWIDETFGIPVWLHLHAPLRVTGSGGFARWNHRRLRKKYLAVARAISAADAAILEQTPAHPEQLILRESGIRFFEAGAMEGAAMPAILQQIIRKRA